MENFGGIAKLLIILGGCILLTGILLLIFGKLPGDFSVKGKNWSFYLPLGTSILLSILLTFLMWILRKF